MKTILITLLFSPLFLFATDVDIELFNEYIEDGMKTSSLKCLTLIMEDGNLKDMSVDDDKKLSYEAGYMDGLLDAQKLIERCKNI